MIVEDPRLTYSIDAKVIDPETGKPMPKVFVAGGSSGGGSGGSSEVTITGQTAGLATEAKQTEIVTAVTNGNNTQSTAEKQDAIIQAMQENTTQVTSSMQSLQDGVHILTQDSAKIFGVYWNKSSSPTMIRTDDAKDLAPTIGVDGALVENPFDKLPIYRDIVDVKDELGNVFVQIPKFYIQEKMGKGFYHLRISQTKHPGFYLPEIFRDHVTGKELPYYWHGKHKGWADTDNVLRSIPGVGARMGHSIGFYRSMAAANNKDGRLGYQMMDIHAVNAIQALFLVEHATLHSQSVMQGFVSSPGNANAVPITVAETEVTRLIVSKENAARFVVGQELNFKGGFIGTLTAFTPIDDANTAIEFLGAAVTSAVGDYLWGAPWKSGFSRDILPSSGSLTSNTSGMYPCVYRGIESPWGDCEQFVDGIILISRAVHISNNPAEYSDHTLYKPVGYSVTTTGGAAKEMGFNPDYPAAKLPIAANGEAYTTYYCDRWALAGSGTRVCTYGGYYGGGYLGGLFAFDFIALATSSGNQVSGRLCKKALE